MARRRQAFAPRGQRRRSIWELGPGGDDIQFDSQQITASSSIILGSAITVVDTELTVVRTRGFFHLQLSVATAALDGFNYALGIGIASNAAIAVGASAVPTPFTEVDAENWLWHHMGKITSPIAGVATGAAQSAQTIEVDSKAMRRLEDGSALYMAAEFGEIGTASLTIAGVTRCLFKLP